MQQQVPKQSWFKGVSLGDTPYSRRTNRRIRLWILLASAPVAIGTILLGVSPKTTLLGMAIVRIVPVCIAVTVLATVAVYWYVRRINKRLAAELARTNWKLCTHCTQDLSGLADAGVCPECGERFEAVRDAAAWKVDTSGLPPTRQNLGHAYGEAWDAAWRRARKLTKHNDDEK